MQDFASNFQKNSAWANPPPKLGGLFKFKSDLFNKNEVKTLNIKAISCVMSYLGLGNNFA
jgi:hypothetical protein